jgi:hypothetical protein
MPPPDHTRKMGQLGDWLQHIVYHWVYHMILDGKW